MLLITVISSVLPKIAIVFVYERNFIHTAYVLKIYITFKANENSLFIIQIQMNLLLFSGKNICYSYFPLICNYSQAQLYYWFPLSSLLCSLASTIN